MEEEEPQEGYVTGTGQDAPRTIGLSSYGLGVPPAILSSVA